MRDTLAFKKSFISVIHIFEIEFLKGISVLKLT